MKCKEKESFKKVNFITIYGVFWQCIPQANCAGEESKFVGIYS